MRAIAIPLLVLAAASGCSTTKSSTGPAASTEALPFIEDDYPRAVAVAKQKSLPIFVDIWAPW